MPDICLDVPAAYTLLEHLGNKMYMGGLLTEDTYKELPTRSESRPLFLLCSLGPIGYLRCSLLNNYDLGSHFVVFNLHVHMLKLNGGKKSSLELRRNNIGTISHVLNFLIYDFVVYPDKHSLFTLSLRIACMLVLQLWVNQHCDDTALNKTLSTPNVEQLY